MRTTTILLVALAAVAAHGQSVEAQLDQLEAQSYKTLQDIHGLKSPIAAAALKVAGIEATIDAAKSQNDKNQQALQNLDPRLSGVATKSKFFSWDGVTLYVVGANLNVRHSTDPATKPNGLGNVIVGYNSGTGLARTGSLNLVVGAQASYTGRRGLVGGFRNQILNDGSVVLAGTDNRTWYKSDGVTATGTGNDNFGYRGVVLTGYKNVLWSSNGWIGTGDWNQSSDGGVVLTGHLSHVDTFGGLLWTGESANVRGAYASVGVGRTATWSKDWTWATWID